MPANKLRYKRTGLIARRSIILGGLSGIAALVSPAVLRAQTDTFRFGLTPVFLSNDLELLRSLQLYLSAKLKAPVELVARRTYQEITALLVSSQIHSAWICGYPFVQFRSALDLVATPIWRGKPLYQSYIIAGHDRKVDDWQQLRGDIHAYSDPDSNSGYLVTQALLTENGLGKGNFFSRYFFTYGHRNVIRAVARGLAQSGSVDGYVWEVMRQLEPELVDQTKIVRRSEWLGFPPIASPKLLASDARIAKLRAALIDMKTDEQGRMILSMLKLDGFAVEDEALFDKIAAKMAIVRAAT
ncbi:PhnD/SsuA/transferrin family substrate-binding protein [Phyllobacterium zundukense]|uniref:PhnD/SsuA/transferrin family substrate-binding protein n=1 Tax=Phyllobacterium zundukense TaxID=1867719 RepID=A0ACD4CX87_9HYPH|nr:PhnD/SsuA/transferrin family substrate-binding protein [Phyllobacterium zundukense]UXN58223.1 PhnD/SsuA/transferrin family substrate-binding protein [Phyllobacterium zundukense]